MMDLGDRHVSQDPIDQVRADKVAAAIVTYNRVDVLDASLAAIRGQSTPPGAVIVVDNASSDGTAEIVHQRFPDVTLVSMPDNTGAAGGFARALEEAAERGYEWTWIFNDDDVPDPAALQTMLAELAKLSTRTGVLACVRRGSDGNLHSPGALWRHRLREISYDQSGATLAADIVTFSGTLIATRLVADIGLPRADFFMMMEDQEFCLRARRAGWAIGVVSVPLVKSMNIGSVGQAPPWRGYYQTRNHLLMALDRRSAFEIYWWGVRTAKLSLAALVSGSNGPSRAGSRLRGAWHGLRGVTGRTVTPG